MFLDIWAFVLSIVGLFLVLQITLDVTGFGAQVQFLTKIWLEFYENEESEIETERKIRVITRIMAFVHYCVKVIRDFLAILLGLVVALLILGVPDGSNLSVVLAGVWTLAFVGNLHLVVYRNKHGY